MNEQLIQELIAALRAYKPGKTIEVGNVKYGYDKGYECFRVGSEVYTDLKPGRYPKNLKELKERFTKIKANVQKRYPLLTKAASEWIEVMEGLLKA